MSAASGQVRPCFHQTFNQDPANKLNGKEKEQAMRRLIHLVKIVSVCFSHFSFLPEPGRNLRAPRQSWKRKTPLCRWKMKEGAPLSWPTASTVQETDIDKEVQRGSKRTSTRVARQIHQQAELN